MAIKLKTAEAHKDHDRRDAAGNVIPCDCATTPEDAVLECNHCGAMYTQGAMSFNCFVCYDCGGARYKWVEQKRGNEGRE